MGGFNYAAFFLLGVDSLIACIVTGPLFIKQRRHEHSELRSPDEHKHASQWKWWAIGGVSALAVPNGLSYGVGDGLGYLLGTLFHFSVSDTLSSVVETTLLVALGLYWIGIYFVARKMQASEQLQKWSWRGIWVLPVALSIDNLTYGAVTGVPADASVCAAAGLQALASAAIGPDRYDGRNRPRGPNSGTAHSDVPHLRGRGRRRDRHGGCSCLHRLVNRSCASPSPRLRTGATHIS